MTVIAAKIDEAGNYEIVSDSCQNYDEINSPEATKLIRISKNFAFGCAGGLGEIQLMRVYCHENLSDLKKIFSTKVKNNLDKVSILYNFISGFLKWVENKLSMNYTLDSCYLFAFNGELFYSCYEDEGKFGVYSQGDVWSIGSGGRTCYGMLKAGVDIQRAVELTCDIDPYCHPPLKNVTSISENNI